MSAVLLGPFGMYRASALVNMRSMTFQPSGWPSWVQSLASDRALNASRILVTVASTSVAAICLNGGGFGVTGSRPTTLR